MRAPRSASVLSRTLLLGALLAGPPSLALAQPAPPAPAAATPTQQSDDLFAKGKTLLKEGKKQEALDAYRAAWKLRKSYDVAGNLGSLEMDLGLHRDAAEHLTYAVTHYASSGTTKDQLDKARQRLEAARKEVCALRVAVNVEGAEVLVDGVPIARAPIGEEVFVTPGARSIEARFPGHVSAKKAIDARKGATEEVKLDLQAQPVAVVTSAPTATVAPPPPPSRSVVPALAIGGAGVASLVVAGVLIGVAEGQRGQLRADLPHKEDGTPLCGRPDAEGPKAALCDDFRARGAGINTMAHTSIFFFALGGVAVLGAGAYWLWPQPSSTQKATSRVVPVVAPATAGLLWTGSF